MDEPRTPRQLLRRLPFGLLLLIMVFALGMGAGATLNTLLQPQSRSQAAPAATTPVQVFDEAWDLVHSHYVDPSAINDQKMLAAAINGMLDTLGDTGHTRYLTPDEVTTHSQELSGQYVGVGIQVEQRDGQVVVVAPLDGSPAQRAGIRAGDILLEVDGQSVQGLSLDDVVQRVRGPAGSTVTLVFRRPGQTDLVRVTLTRAQIKVSSVSWAMLPQSTIALVRISQFSDGTAADLRRAVQDAQRAGATSFILDLRNNPGGLVNEAIGTASVFLPPQTPVFIAKTRDGNQTIYRTEASEVRVDQPLVVLVNKGTASAAEIVAGALQDNQRAKIIGERTFGTGTVLTEYRLKDGSALLLGTELWLTPNGRQIWKNGISPDIAVSLPDQAQPFILVAGASLDSQALSQDDQLQTAIAVLTGAPLPADAPRGPGCTACR